MQEKNARAGAALFSRSMIRSGRSGGCRGDKAGAGGAGRGRGVGESPPCSNILAPGLELARWRGQAPGPGLRNCARGRLPATPPPPCSPSPASTSRREPRLPPTSRRKRATRPRAPETIRSSPPIEQAQPARYFRIHSSLKLRWLAAVLLATSVASAAQAPPAKPPGYNPFADPIAWLVQTSVAVNGLFNTATWRAKKQPARLSVRYTLVNPLRKPLDPRTENGKQKTRPLAGPGSLLDL